jgi:hemolysin activation/secretion protein
VKITLRRSPLALLATLALGLGPFGTNCSAGVVPQSGQLLQETPPSSMPSSSSNPGLTIEQPTQSEPRSDVPFRVEHIEITGNTVIPTQALRPLVASAEGHKLWLADLERVAGQITQYYRSHGFLLSRAYIPAQTLSGGTVRIAVLEARYGRVSLINRSRVSDDLLKSILAGLPPGAAVTETGLERALLLASDVPGAVVGSTLAPGAALGSSDLDVSAAPGAPVTGTVGLDDAGNRYTGRARANTEMDFNNPFHRGDTFSVSAMTSGSELNYGKLGYQTFVDGDGTQVGASASALHYRLGGGLAGLDAHGTAQVESATVTQPFIRSTGGNLYGQLTFDGKQLHDDIDSSGIKTDRHTDSLTATLAGDRRDSEGVSNLAVGAAIGTLGFDNEDAELADAATARTRGSYGKFTLSLARLQTLSNLNSVYLALNGQWADKNLDSSEQFFLGGPNSVRAYDVGVLGGAMGGLASAELRHHLALAAPGSWQAIAFLDTGTVKIEKTPFAVGPNRAEFSGAGVGLMWTEPSGWSANLDVASPVGGEPALAGHADSVHVWVDLHKAFKLGPTVD